ncbi:MAG: hypothetical protein ACKPKO_41620, partial [Candidatus Fonsibacter sp.]
SSSKVRSASVKAASVAAVVEFASERECLERRIGGREQKTFDDIFDRKLVQLFDGCNVAYREHGPPTFAEYLQRAYWNNLVPSEETGYVDPGWLRAFVNIDEPLLVDSRGRKHLFWRLVGIHQR